MGVNGRFKLYPEPSTGLLRPRSQGRFGLAAPLRSSLGPRASRRVKPGEPEAHGPIVKSALNRLNRPQQNRDILLSRQPVVAILNKSQIAVT